MAPRGIPPSNNASRLRGRAIGDLSSIADGEVLTWDAGAAQFVAGSGGGAPAALGVGMVVGVAYATADGDTAPAGCLWCEGQNVSRTTYASLFALVGTTWGAGDGSTFGLPDLRGRTLLGRSAAGSPTQVGATGGSRNATLVAHQHGLTDGSNTLARGNGAAAAGPMIQGNDGIAATSYSTDTQGSSATDANLPPYAAVRWAIVADAGSGPGEWLVSRVTRSADQTGVASGSYQAVVFNVAGTDTAGASDAANGRLTIPSTLDGRYGTVALRLVLSGTPAFAAAEQVGARIVRRDSGGTLQEVWEQRTGNSTVSAIWAFNTGPIPLVDGDRFSAEVLYGVNVGGRTVAATFGAEFPIDLTLTVNP